jgi:TonB family protein
MLKPDSTRYSSVLQTRISGPEWIGPDSPEADPPESGTNASGHPAFGSQQDLPTDLALDLRLHEILQQARLATAASGALIALACGNKMVCRATLGDKAPSTGVRLNTHSGLSGACVQTREMQLCDDTLADARVNAVACRDLGIRSIVVLPVLDGGDLWGVLEIFSSAPHAFNESDLQTLQSLSRRISNTVQEAMAGGSALAPEAFSQPPAEDSAPTDSEQLGLSLNPSELGTEIARKDYRTSLLTAAVLALAVLLGWMVGRVGWSLAVNRAPIQIPMTEEAQATPQAIPNTQPPPRSPKAADARKPEAATTAPPAPVKPAPKPKVRTAEPMGGLVVYEHGKVVFRMAPSQPESPTMIEPGVVGSDAIQKAAIHEDEKTVASVPATAATSGYLLQRVEPEYPEAARKQLIQGPVVLTLLVGISGSVKELTVVSGDPQLTKAATDAVWQWRFKPHQLKGKTVEFETRVTVNFALPE